MTTAKAKKTVVALGGAGIGVEVVDATCELLTGAGFPIEILMPPHADAAVKSHGVPVPDETQRLCREADGVLFGAAGGPPSSAVVMWLRWQLGTFASVRPARHYPGASSPLANPEGIDLIILRENSEGMYPGREGDLADLKRVMPDLSDRAGTTIQKFGDGQFAVKVVTEAGAARIARFACDLARRRKAAGRPGKVTCVTKSNVLPRTDGLFQKTAEKVVRASPDLSFEHFYVDDACRRLVRFPQSMDVVLCMNQYGDILSDIAAEVAGGLGMAPSGCYAPDWAYFESVHGSAPDIAGKGIANPTGTILSAAMMLDHIGLREEAARLEAAVARVYQDGKALTPDQGGKGTTKGFSAAVLAALRNSS